mmetsp:Transcript_51721/g.123110  ORF Transcript_51721/g.123110 Transcript_51721/m.123110 type:complete len:83 (-) Transcript_51721:106-354(-)|eukprot:CAMPEP_0178407190 /NCGR_PEP_ID=MMETSP0689_2-20121128/19299_1 /TAXON_ID=160604 /ORGANISM="Amphidinium massartii, Strain CS-259" /LENGTH=82 /DNA_ID=CAMNT_0020028253 /DNA_START=95 /DNA_END=343 /DNA_ORIENTATION=-
MCDEENCNQFCSLICAYLIPPLGVWWRFGCGWEFCVCLILTILGYVPGVIFACIMIGCDTPDRYEEEGNPEDGYYPKPVYAE